MKDKTRLFYVVSADMVNEEIFDTLESAEEYAETLTDYTIYIAEVRNAYFENDLQCWNYEDFSDTFTFIKKIK